MTSFRCFSVCCLVYFRRASFEYNMAYSFTISARLIISARTTVNSSKSIPKSSRQSFVHSHLGNSPPIPMPSKPWNGKIAPLDNDKSWISSMKGNTIFREEVNRCTAVEITLLSDLSAQQVTDQGKNDIDDAQ